MSCSLTKFYIYLAVAMALLAVAIIMAFFFVTIPGLAVAIGCVVVVSLVLIPLLKAELEAYEKCRGQSFTCHIAPAIDWLGLAAGALSFISFLIALLLVTGASALLSNFVTAALSLPLQAAAQTLAYSGAAGCAVAVVYLSMLLQSVWTYISCKDKEDATFRPPTGSSGAPTGTAPV